MSSDVQLTRSVILVQRLGVLLEVIVRHVRHLWVKEIVSPKFSGPTHEYPP